MTRSASEALPSKVTEQFGDERGRRGDWPTDGIADPDHTCSDPSTRQGHFVLHGYILHARAIGQSSVAPELRQPLMLTDTRLSG